jgi:predicted DNA-binding protein (UPF0251 family)
VRANRGDSQRAAWQRRRVQALQQADLPETIDGWALKHLEHMSRAECADRLGITRQAVEQAEKSGLKKLAAMRHQFEEYL